MWGPGFVLFSTLMCSKAWRLYGRHFGNKLVHFPEWVRERADPCGGQRLDPGPEPTHAGHLGLCVAEAGAEVSGASVSDDHLVAGPIVGGAWSRRRGHPVLAEGVHRCPHAQQV